MSQRFSIALVAAMLVAGCSSGVKLDQAPVEDRSATSTTGSTDASGNASGTSQSGVKGVDLNGADSKAAGPVGVERLVYFDYDSYVIKDEYRPLVAAHAKFLASNPKMKVLIQGNADERGSREYNLALGQKRAEALKKNLATLNVKEDQLEAVSLGEEKPRCTESTDECWAQNRRADLRYPAK